MTRTLKDKMAELPPERQEKVHARADELVAEETAYRSCMAEIEGVLKKYDMAGTVAVVAKNRAAYSMVFPTWSLMQPDGARGVRVLARREDFPDDHAMRNACELTAHIAFQMRDIASNMAVNWQSLCDMLQKHWDVEHKGGVDFDPEYKH